MPQPLLVRDEHDDFATAVRAGLGQPRKIIPARFFYDRVGSELFEDITRLPEYYPTQTEIGLLKAYATEIGAVVGPGRAVVEFGSGSSAKTPLLLAAIAPSAYIPVDISAEFLSLAAAALAAAFPGVAVLPVAADFTKPFRVPAAIGDSPMLGFFPGSTLGNLAPAAAVDLLRGFAETLGPDSWLVIGLDLAPGAGKSRATLEAAYNDAQGVTAAFNLNLLHRINRDLGGDVPVDAFAHRAVWNADLGRIEMHLVATRDVAFMAAGECFAMRADETIHTENSYKWTLPETRLLARASGWDPVRDWSDDGGRFSLQLWRRAGTAMEP